jgi:hypothetical protein
MNKRLRFGFSAVCASKGPLKKKVASAINRPSHASIAALLKADGWPQAVVREGFI